MGSRLTLWWIVVPIISAGLSIAALAAPPKKPKRHPESGKSQGQAKDPEFEDLKEDDYPDLVPADEKGEFMDELPDQAEADFPDLVRADEEGGVMDEFALLSEEEVVYTASRHRQKIGYSPSTVLVITAKDIEESGATNLLQLLRHYAAAHVWEVDPVFQVASFRGSYKALLIVDGVVQNSEIIAAPFYPLIPKGMSEIDRVEVVLGPNSALYGANAVSAVVNVITRRPVSAPSVNLRLTAGEHGGLVVDGFVESGIEPWAARLSFGMDRTEHWMDRRVVSRSVLRAAGRFDMDIPGGGLGLDTGIVSMAGQPYVGIGNMDLEYMFNAHAKAELKLENFTALAYWYHLQTKLTIDFNMIHPETGIELVEPPDGNVALDGIHTEAQYNLELFEGNLLIFGADFWYTSAGAARLIATGIREIRLGTFLRAEQRMFDGLELTVGARVDYNSITETALNPQGALVYNPAGEHFLRLSGGMGFRKPTLIETRAALDVDVHPSFPEIEDLLEGQGISNPDLHNEKVRSIELGYRGAFFDRALRVNADAYYVENREQVNFISNIRFLPPWNIQIDMEHSYVRYQNSRSNDHNIYGLHVSVEGEPVQALTLFVRGEIRRAQHEHTDSRYGSVPETLFTSGMELRLPFDLQARLTWIYVGQRFEGILDPVSLLLPNRWLEVPASSYWMGYLSYRLDLGRSAVDLGLLAFNLLGGGFREYPGGPRPDGRNFAGQMLDRRIMLTARLLY